VKGKRKGGIYRGELLFPASIFLRWHKSEMIVPSRSGHRTYVIFVRCLIRLHDTIHGARIVFVSPWERESSNRSWNSESNIPTSERSLKFKLRDRIIIQQQRVAQPGRRPTP
jgi:hypothetical protein